MSTLKTFLLLAVAAVASAQVMQPNPDSAIKNTRNPPGAAYMGMMTSMCGGMQGAVVAMAVPTRGVHFAINLQNLDPAAGPFSVQLNTMPVPPDGNCSATMGTLDPWNRTSTPPCNSQAPETCQVGDLSGKYGWAGMNETLSWEAQFMDPYVSMDPENPAFIGNSSIVVTTPDLTSIACTNLTWIGTKQTKSNFCLKADY